MKFLYQTTKQNWEHETEFKEIQLEFVMMYMYTFPYILFYTC